MAHPAVAGAVDDRLGGDLPDGVRSRMARTERVTQLMARAVGRALAAADRLAFDDPPPRDVGIVVGTAFGCFLSNASHQQRVREAGPASASPRVFAATVSNAAAGEIGIAYRLGGPAVTLIAGAASGLTALTHATALLAEERCAALVAGGGDALGPPLMRWLTEAGMETHPPSEAAAFVVLETAATAARRGARALATVLGGGVGFDDLAAPVATALAQAGVRAVDLRVVVRGAPPPLRQAEARLIASLVDDTDAQVLPVKNHLGESFGAAGVLGLLVALPALAPGEHALLLDACGTGHVAALVVRRENP